jgi:hypothetical protein
MAVMRQELSDFLVRLGDEPELFEEYIKDRETVMERECVTLADRDAILSGDLREIRARLRSGSEAMVVMEGEPPDEEPPTVMKPEEEPPVVMEPEEEPPTVMEPEEPPTVMEPDTEYEPEPDEEPEAV